jgi:hypothetical protein
MAAMLVPILMKDNKLLLSQYLQHGCRAGCCKSRIDSKCIVLSCVKITTVDMGSRCTSYQNTLIGILAIILLVHGRVWIQNKLFTN